MSEVTDAVCGMTFPEEGALELGASKVEHAGRTYWFCCPHCEAEFKAAPEKYAR